jgi:ureidoacrylate peracid hydrolase
MVHVTYHKQRTALLVIDPYNDFIAEGGKVWDRLKAVAEANKCVPHMMQVLDAARKADIRVFYALHRRYRPGDYESWQYIAPIQERAWSHKTFEDGTWGGEIRREFAPQPGDIVALEHWCSSGFANTDLDVQLSSMASISSSSSASWPTRAWSPPSALLLSWVTRSRW